MVSLEPKSDTTAAALCGPQKFRKNPRRSSCINLFAG